MVAGLFSLQKASKKLLDSVKLRGSEIDLVFKFGGVNKEIAEMYHWHINFPYYTGVGFTPLKVEDYHYFSENSQFGAQMRQMKGGSVRAFQENLQQLVQLIKVHMMPLLKEVKQADYYKTWFENATHYDDLYQKEKSKSSPDESLLRSYKNERDQALKSIKDKWVTEIDGGKMWQMQASSSERGLDYTLLPQLFFGTELNDPFQTKQSLKEQLDEMVYEVDISYGAKDQVAQFMYRFYHWLPGAIRDTEMNFNIKLTSLKQMYAQLGMYVETMRPLLKEVARKSEGLNKQSFYKNFDMEHPDFINILDQSYSFVKVLGIKGFQRGGYSIEDLEIGEFGYFVPSSGISQGEYKGKTGIVSKQEGENYIFHPCNTPPKTKKEFEALKKKEVPIMNFKPFSCMIFDFSQRRRNETRYGQQGAYQLPLMSNQIDYKGHVWTLVEIAVFRQQLKLHDLELLESFIGELKLMKEDLEKYVLGFEEENSSSEKTENSKEEQEKKPPFKGDTDLGNLLLGPFKAVVELTSPLVPSVSLGSSKKTSSAKPKTSSNSNPAYEKEQRAIVEGVWKLYTINKKAHRYMMY